MDASPFGSITSTRLSLTRAQISHSLVVGDRVHLEMTPYDLTKGRIVFRERTPGQAGPAKRRNNFRK